MSVAFDKRLAELDAYLQMLILENDSIDRKLDSISSSTANVNCDVERDGLISIKNSLDNLIGSIKHSIVLLQIAKVSLKSSTLSTGSESPSSTTATPPPPIRPARPSKSASSTPSSKENIFTRSKKSPKFNEINKNMSSFSDNSPDRVDQWQAQHYQQQRQQQRHYSPSSQTPAAVVSPSTVLDAEGVHHGSEFMARTAVRCDGVGGSSSYKSANVARAAHSVSPNLKSATTTGGSNCNDGVVGNAVHEDKDDDDDDDDAFFDAADEQHNKSTIPKVNTDPVGESSAEIINENNDNNVMNILSDRITSLPTLVNDKESPINRNITLQHTDNMPSNRERNNNLNTTVSNGSIDWDALYEDEDEEDLGSLESQGSVIKHLLSQIRIGMDLTKVVLPTFILERRSLLEMYADFFAHPDLFSAIPDFKTPEERMIQLVRWYLSAFHAGRKSSVAKKPYNPILGEIFKCQWQLEEDKASDKRQQKKASDNNESGAQRLTFIAEQVSHHPPVSAFHAENQEKSISCSAHIYTKSKYLGLSVGVNNIGTGVINLLNHNETYVCTFPSAYGRSILTVPWVELGGPVNIVCNETGYKANIEFVTKPFYGGKKHRVVGEILRPTNERFLTIDGEWNGIMYSKSPLSSTDKEIFVDTTNLPVIKKHVEPVTVQDSFESRNVWKEVTRALKLQDITTATAAKSFIEQRQRDLLKDRLEKGVKWKARYFEASDDGWTFSRPSSPSPGASCGSVDNEE